MEKTVCASAATSYHSIVDMKIVGVVIRSLLITTYIVSLAEAAVVQHCPSKNELPWYWNEIERRCEVCSVSLCATLRPPPEACRCFCKNNLPSGGNSVHEGECADGISKEEGKGQSSSEVSIPRWALWVIVSGIILIGVVILVMVFKKCLSKSRIKECFRKQFVSTITINTSERPIAPIASGQLQPTGTPVRVCPGLTAPPSRISQPENQPIQATEDGKKTEETCAKTPLIESNQEETRRQDVPRQAVGPSYPSEGAPGGKYSLIPQNDHAEANV